MAEIEHRNRDYCPECGANQKKRSWYVGRDLGNGQYQAVCYECSLKYSAILAPDVTQSIEDEALTESMVRIVNQRQAEIDQLRAVIYNQKQVLEQNRRDFTRLQQNYDLLKAELEEREE